MGLVLHFRLLRRPAPGQGKAGTSSREKKTGHVDLSTAISGAPKLHCHEHIRKYGGKIWLGRRETVLAAAVRPALDHEFSCIAIQLVRTMIRAELREPKKLG